MLISMARPSGTEMCIRDRYNAGINISMISTSEIKVSVLVDINEADRAVQVIHDRFFHEFGGN